MKTKKITLDDLKLESFLTILNEIENVDILGGGRTDLNGDCYSNNCSDTGCPPTTNDEYCPKGTMPFG